MSERRTIFPSLRAGKVVAATRADGGTAHEQITPLASLRLGSGRNAERFAWDADPEPRNVRLPPDRAGR